MKQRRWGRMLLLLIAAFSLVLASCASSDDDEGTGSGEEGGGETAAAATCQGETGVEATAADLGGDDDPDGAGTKVGLVFDIGGKDDDSFNESAYNGLIAAEENMGVDVYKRQLEPSPG